jgi:sarcosine oxidase subunit alpha
MTTTSGGAARVLGWMERWVQTEWPDMQVYMTSVTDHWSTFAVAGPKSRDVVRKVAQGVDLSNEAFPFMSWREATVAGVRARIMRISFSGEMCFEVNVPSNTGAHVWQALMQAGAEFGITPYGTEAMHVLRAEKGYIIVGQDTDGSITPHDLGMGGMVAKTKDFLGRRSLGRPQAAGRPADRRPASGAARRHPAHRQAGRHPDTGADAGPCDLQLPQPHPEALHCDGGGAFGPPAHGPEGQCRTGGWPVRGCHRGQHGFLRSGREIAPCLMLF